MSGSIRPAAAALTSGAIALVGSGEYLPAMAQLESLLLEDAVLRGKPRRYVQLPTAAGREGEARLAYWGNLGAEQGRRIGAPTTVLPVLDRESADDAAIAKELDRAGLVYLSGGDPGYLAETLVGTRVGDAIARHWHSGGAVAGCSAGAMVLGDEVPRFRLRRSSDATRGFGLLPSLRVIPHFNRLFAFAFSRFAAGEVPVGIEDLTALVRMSGEADWGVYGRGAVHMLGGGATRRLRSGERVSIE